MCGIIEGPFLDANLVQIIKWNCNAIYFNHKGGDKVYGIDVGHQAVVIGLYVPSVINQSLLTKHK